MKKTLIIIVLISIGFFSNAQLYKLNELNSGIIKCFAGSGTNIYAGTSKGGVFLSTDNGESWSATNNGLSGEALNIFSIDVCEEKIIANTLSGLFLSTNNGKNWKALNAGVGNKIFSNFFVRDTNIYTMTSHRLYLSTNCGDSWTLLDSSISFSDIKDIAINGTNIFIAAKDFGVFRSTNNGKSWSAVNNGLPIISSYWENIGPPLDTFTHYSSVNSIVVNGLKIIAGTTAGVYISTNNGESWISANSGLTNKNVRVLLTYGSNLYAGTSSGLFLSTNNGESWIPGLQSNFSVISLAIFGTNLFVCTNDRVKVFDNLGKHWFSKTITSQSQNNSQNSKIETISIPPNTGFDIEATEGCFKINKVIGGKVSITDGYIKEVGLNGPYNLNFGYEPRCCPLTLDCNTKYSFRNYGTSTAKIELEKITK